jgi:UDP-N-acetyl-D-glucosamine dehydrogenase
VNTKFIELAGEVNTQMPNYVLGRVADALNDHGKPLKGSNVCVLGVAYKKDVDDPRESPAFTILEALEAKGAVVSYHDPFVPALPTMRHHTIRLTSSPLTAEFLAAQDAVLVVTDHTSVDYRFVVAHSRLVIDTRNACAGAASETCQVVKA